MPSPTDDRSSAPSSPPRGRSGSRVVVMVSGNTTTTYSVTSSVTASENGLVMYESDQTPTAREITNKTDPPRIGLVVLFVRSVQVCRN